VRGLHAGFLEFLEQPAGFDTGVLPHLARIRIVVADQHHMVT
jgi:hypothetical protein